jgi:zinc-ribbon domain
MTVRARNRLLSVVAVAVAAAVIVGATFLTWTTTEVGVSSVGVAVTGNPRSLWADAIGLAVTLVGFALLTALAAGLGGRIVPRARLVAVATAAVTVGLASYGLARSGRSEPGIAGAVTAKHESGTGPFVALGAAISLLFSAVVAGRLAEPSTPRHKHCPQCAENVRVEAKVCRYCGHHLTTAPPPA